MQINTTFYNSIGITKFDIYAKFPGMYLLVEDLYVYNRKQVKK